MTQKTQIKTPDYKLKRDIVKILLIVIFFVVPFIRISGAPLLRFDLHEQAIYILGQTISVSQIFPMLLGLFSLLFFFIFFTQMLGRIWCGWMCPQTVILECLPGGGNLNVKLKGLRKVRFVLMAAVVSVLFTFGFILYTTNPGHFMRMLAHGDIHFLWWILAAVIFLNLVFIGRRFCRTVCPYCMFQSVMYDADTLRVAFDPERADECINCNACVHACPTQLDIRKGLSNKCICCAYCVDACGKVLARLDKTTLVDYFFGRRIFRPFRANRLITLGLAALFLGASLIAFNSSSGIRLKVDEIKESTVYISAKNTRSEPVFLAFYHKGQEVESLEVPPESRQKVHLQLIGKPDDFMEVRVVEGRKTYTRRLDLRRENRNH